MAHSSKDTSWNPPPKTKLFRWFEDKKGGKKGPRIPPDALLKNHLFVVRTTGPDDYEGYLKKPKFKEF